MARKLFTWPPFGLWMIVIALAILGDKNETGFYPRWAAYYTVWCALALAPASLIAFWKDGPFAYNGAISFWFAFFMFFIWMCTMTYLTLKATTREDRRLTAEPEDKPEADRPAEGIPAAV